MKRYFINCSSDDVEQLHALGITLGLLLPEVTVTHIGAPGVVWIPDTSEPGRFKAILELAADFAAIAAERATVRKEVADALQDLPRYFEVDATGKPISEDV